MTPVHFGILAAERSGPSPFHEAEGVSLKTLVDIAGEPMLSRVIATVSAVAPGAPVLCGPAREQRADAPWLEAALEEGAVRWLPPEPSPAQSAEALWSQAEAEGSALLLTTGDHPLLTPETLRAFWAAAEQGDQDVAVGLASYDAVQAAFPHSRRTAQRFSDGAFCGTNLFYFRGAGARGVLTFWREVEALRKRPDKMLRTLGLGLAARYLAGRLSLTAALDALGERTGARCRAIPVHDPDAAVDVDSLEDLATVRARFAARAAEAERP